MRGSRLEVTILGLHQDRGAGETESSSKDLGAEGGSATWVLTLHLLLVSLRLASSSDGRGATGGTAEAQTTFLGCLSAVVGEECISLLKQGPVRFLAFIFDLFFF